MITLGIDPGTAITGYGLINEEQDGSLTVVDYGVIRTKSDESQAERLVQLYHKIKNLILLHHPITGAVEKLFFERNVRTAIHVGEARGVALLAMAEQNLPIGEYTPLEVKQAVAGYGAAEKSQVQQMVRALLCLESIPQPDDAADALAVAICHIHSQKILRLYDQSR
ncbi:MAG: crossover junction endodeoxyribonuclease RuvC [Anaerolineales bacterium]|nr:crossover junction endodeoxyribonuclease RuvC [Anaerolineae bacterium]PWB53046.1 MAG: crossover junction endodeoxyribonuclease RuvC [Anaerolineales bacterium]